MAKRSRRGTAYGAWLLLASSLAGLIMATIITFNKGNGIAYTPGTYLVMFSTSMLVLGSLLLFIRRMPRWLSGLIIALLLIDLLGTALAAYLLMAYGLVALMAVVLVAWLFHVFVDPAHGKSRHSHQRGALT
ncbi:MAG: hypothetical protein UMU75_10715 [Halomonas sp.]|nr:hypothetical protein [Halomonas sp.]